jgi:two-component system LytT family sensor kinase
MSAQMNIRIPFQKIIVALHILIWSVILLLPYMISDAGSDYRIGTFPGLFFTLCGVIHMGIFYLHALWIYPRLWNKQYWWLYFPAVLLLIAVSFPLKYNIMHAWFPTVLRDMASYRFVFAPSVGAYIVSLVYCKVVERIQTEKRQKEKQAEQLSSELKFLRSQVSPHFLFNVLTNLVSLARKKSDQLEPALIMLSDLRRYMLYDTTGKKVLLTKEIAYLNSYIALQRLRFGNDVDIIYHIDTDNNAGNYTIEPMLLIPFVENAFKHGTGYTQRPEINIQLLVTNDLLTFEVRNKFDNDPNASKDENSGIGLANVKSRLQLLYPGHHQLTIRQQQQVFHITLILKLT